MKTYNPTILNTIAKLKVAHPEFVEQSGLGYCANASLVLKEELSKIGIEGKLLYGKYLKDNRAGQVAKAHFSNLIKHFPISNGFHGRVKSHYVKNGHKVSDKGGHVGVLVGSDVYDVTSAQFGLPIAYPLEQFLDMWGDAHIVDITLGPKKTAWTQKVLYSYQTKDQQAVSMEGYGSAMGFEEGGPDPTITDIILKLKAKNNNYSVNSGLGYCSEASVALKRELDRIGIDSKLIYGKHLSDNVDGNTAKNHLSDVIKNYVPGPGFFGKIKANYIKNGNKVSGELGHMVVLVKDFVYDVTSAQFGLPLVYSFSKFKGMWDLVQEADSQNTTYKGLDKHNVSMEGMVNSFGVDVQSEDSEFGEFMSWFKLQSKKVQTHSKIVSAEEVGQDYMLHIDKKTPAVFNPMMPRSASATEDNTAARITVSPSLLGCMLGYARVEMDVQNGTKTTDVKRTGFRGGYEICELEFKYCLAVNTKLVYDADVSNEHWPVTYNKKTMNYKPVKVGEFFVKYLTYEASSGSQPNTIITFYLHVIKESGFNYGLDKHVDKGFYKCVTKWDSSEELLLNKEDQHIESISGSEYAKHKGLSAAMLSMESINKPKYLNW